MENIELKLLEELNKLQRFALKTPIDSKNFWRDWQSLYTTVRFSQIAVKSLLEGDNLSQEEVKHLKKKLHLLREVENYLKELREVALQVKGYSIFSTEGSEEGNDDLDDLLF